MSAGWQSSILDFTSGGDQLRVTAPLPTAATLRSDGFGVNDRYMIGSLPPIRPIVPKGGSGDGMPIDTSNYTLSKEEGDAAEPKVHSMVFGQPPVGMAQFIRPNAMLLAVGHVETTRPGRDSTVVTTIQHFNCMAQDIAHNMNINLQTAALEIERNGGPKLPQNADDRALSRYLGRKRARGEDSLAMNHGVPHIYNFDSVENTELAMLPLGFVVNSSPLAPMDDYRGEINYVYTTSGNKDHVPNLFGNTMVGDRIGFMVGRTRAGTGRVTEEIIPTNTQPVQMYTYATEVGTHPNVLTYNPSEFAKHVRSVPHTNSTKGYTLGTREMFSEEPVNTIHGFAWDDEDVDGLAKRSASYREAQYTILKKSDKTRCMIMTYEVGCAVVHFTGFVQREYHTFGIPNPPKRQEMLTQRNAHKYHHCESYIDIVVP